MVEEKTHHFVDSIVERGHSFGPFGEVVNENYNVLVSIVGWRVTSHEFNAPFAERANCDDWV
jgi:hypothetical protein